MPIDRNSAQYITGALYKPTQTSAPGVWDLDDQANNIAKNLWPLPPQAVQRSLRFNSADSAYLNRTPASAGNRTTWTWSAWVKRAGLYTTNAGPTLFDAGPDNGNFSFVRFLSDSQDKLDFGWVVSGSAVGLIRSNVSFRDPSSWYHIVAVLDTNNATSTDRMRLYVNGQRITSFLSTSYPAQGTATCHINATNAHYLGRSVEPTYRYMDDYMAEVNFIDGQALDATSFGETDQQTGVWIPKRYSGTYGTNGFRLSFANNSSTTALGYDSSGQGNNWTANNFSVTPGSDNDSFVDVPSMYNTDTGIGGEVLANYPTLNPLTNFASPTLSNGNLTFQASGNSYQSSAASMLFPATGKWYLECTLDVRADAGRNQQFNIGDTLRSDNVNLANGYTIYALYTSFEYFYAPLGSAPTNLGIASATGDIVKFAYDADTGKLWSGVNNTWFLSGNPATGSSPMYTFSTIIPRIFQAVGYGTIGKTSINFGQRPFAYAAPSGFKALCTTNLPAPAIGQTSSNQADNHFNVVTYTGNGTAQTITGVGFQPDLVWTKLRNESPSSTWHRLIDSVRGGDRRLSSNDPQAETQNAGLITSFNADGFSVGSDSGVNANGINIVAWCWNAGGTTVTNTSGTITSQVRANQRAGFSIITYTGNGVSYPTGATIGHGLATAPQFIIAKSRDAAGSWNCYHVSVATGNRIDLNSTAAATGDAGVWNSVAPTSTVFSIGNTGNSNISGRTYVAYCFAAVPGFSAFGSYTGNGSADGPFVYLGFRPAFLLFKNISQAYGWQIFDYKRNPNNRVNLGLYPNISNAEGTEAGTGPIDFLSNGFKIRDATWEEINGSTRTYIYAAFAETPARLSSAR
jgi:hypothetical protein